MLFVLFKGQSQYGSMRLHADQLSAALQDLGHGVRIVDLADDGFREQLFEAMKALPDAFFGFGGVGVDVRTDAGSIYDQLRAPYASLYVDHPLYHPGRLTEPVKTQIAFFLDRTHVQFVAAWPKAKGLAHVGFMPPGANELPEPVDVSDEAFARRDIPILFTGTYRGAPKAAWADWAASPAREMVQEVADRMVADGRLAVLDALKAAFAARRAELTGALLDQFVPLLQGPQAFAEAHHRDALLHALGRAGAPLHIYGNGWEPLVARYPSFTWGGVGSFEETLSLLRRTQLVLNTNNGFVAGGHERVFTAMAGGAAVFSDSSRYYASAFKEGREIATFGWNRMEAAPAQLLKLLEDPSALAAMARGGHKRVMAEHRWSHRAQELVRVVRQVK